MDINATLFVEMIIFAAFVLLTMKYVWPPINEALDARKQQIETGLRQAEEGRLKLEESEGEAKEIINAAKDQAKTIVENADKQATSIIANAKTDARDEKKRIIATAEQDVTQLIASKKDEIANELVTVATAIGEKLLDEKISSKKDKDMILKFAESAHAE